MRRTRLLGLVNHRSHGWRPSDPILPLLAHDFEAFRTSPWFTLQGPNNDSSAMEAMAKSSGPWKFHHVLQLPKDARFTTESVAGNITIRHTLKVAISLDGGEDRHGSKRTEVVMQSPLKILPVSLYAVGARITVDICQCQHDAEAASLPGYSSRADHGSICQDLSASTVHHTGVWHPAPGTPKNQRLDSALARNLQFERLISGQENAAGEAPPVYD
jgi:hypothetical protein